ncbi:MAG: DUF3311 domain-containing protein [bacterium]
MNTNLIRNLLYLALIVLYLLHNDLWLWNNASLTLGIPVGLLYHIYFCIAASILMVLVVNYAWPKHLEADEEGGAKS